MDNDTTSSSLSRPSERSESEFSAGLRTLFCTRRGRVVLLMIGVVLLLPYSGFCLFKFRFLSDDEFIDAAIDHVLTMSGHIIETPTGGYAQFVPKKQIGYSGRDEFRRVNPNCCKVVPHDPVWVSIRHELFGQAAKSVYVRYMVNYINEDEKVSRMEALARRAISNCGHVLNTGR